MVRGSLSVPMPSRRYKNLGSSTPHTRRYAPTLIESNSLEKETRGLEGEALRSRLQENKAYAEGQHGGRDDAFGDQTWKASMQMAGQPNRWC